MRLRWLGHASFVITSDSGTSVITDPYFVGGGIDYGPIDLAADIVTISHQHGDHNNASAVKGTPAVIDAPGRTTVKGVEFRGVATFHDDAGGKLRGKNTIFCFSLDNLKICHLGDLGHVLKEGQVSEIGRVDVLLIPVGGFYTIDAKQAATVCDQLKPRLVVPMHFKVNKCGYPIGGVEEFTKNRKNVRRPRASEIEISQATLPVDSETVILEHAL